MMFNVWIKMYWMYKAWTSLDNASQVYAMVCGLTPKQWLPEGVLG